ncbi:MAG: glycogen-binding domain-containing protein [Desulfovibrionales bacterium]
MPEAKIKPGSDDFLDTDQELRAIAAMIGSISSEEPPPGLSDSIMARIRQKQRRSLWQRFSNWARRPVSIHVTPLRLAPVLALLILGMVFLPRLISDRTGTVHKGEQGMVPVVFTLTLEEAETVAVVGSFNDWEPAGYALHRQNGTWVLETALPAGRHEYAFLVNGEKIMVDPGVQFTIEDGFGNRNSLMILGNDDSTA